MCGDLSDTCPEPENNGFQSFEGERLMSLQTNDNQIENNNNDRQGDGNETRTECGTLAQDTCEQKVATDMPNEGTSDKGPNDLTSNEAIKTEDEQVKPLQTHLIQNIVSVSNKSEQSVESTEQAQSKAHAEDSDTPPIRSSVSPTSPLASLALVNTARANMMMNSKPMLQHSFTQTLMALSNNAMNRPSFFPMLEK